VKIIPESYGQFMMYLDARRRCQIVNQSVDGVESKKGGVLE
jgi:acyl-coenzyme A thioesterase 9